MTYLPNSIERCAPILGYDPYAFIMDKPSNLTQQAVSNPAGADNFTPQTPKNTECKTEKKKRKFSIGKFFKLAKFAAGIAAIGAAAVCITKGRNKVRKLFKKPPIKAPKPIRKAVKFLKKDIYKPVKKFIKHIF